MSCKATLLGIGIGAATLAVSACAPVDPGFGDSLRYDMAAQTINPDPVYPATAAKPGSNGEKAAEATKKYRKGQTKPAVRESVQSIPR